VTQSVAIKNKLFTDSFVGLSATDWCDIEYDNNTLTVFTRVAIEKMKSFL
jgi:hypothetical protein